MGDAGQTGRVPCRGAVLGWPRVWTQGHHELSKGTGTGPWQGHKIRMEIRMPTPHWGHSFGWLARRTA